MNDNCGMTNIPLEPIEHALLQAGAKTVLDNEDSVLLELPTLDTICQEHIAELLDGYRGEWARIGLMVIFHKSSADGEPGSGFWQSLRVAFGRQQQPTGKDN